MLNRENIEKHLRTERSGISVFESIDSTNSYLKRAAAAGEPGGAVAVADGQTAGRGRMGRIFQSAAGKGLYLSILLRPDLPPEALLRATGMAAVAVCRALESAAGVQAGIKWTNDLVLGGKKLGGILAETVIQGDEVALVIGVGLNVHHACEDFEGDVADMATSLAAEGYAADRGTLAAALIGALDDLGEALRGAGEDYVAEYRRRCVTIGREVRLLWTEGQERAFAADVDDSFGLVVRRHDGTMGTVRTGEVSVRGLYGYTE